MIVSKQTLAMSVGALTGGFITDDDGSMTMVGAVVGGAIGAHWNFVEPESMDKIKKYNTKLDDTSIAIPKGEREALERFEKKVQTGVYDKKLKKVKKGQQIAPLDVDNLEETLNEVTFKEVMKNGTDEQKLKVKQFLSNSKGFETFENLNGVVIRELASREVESYSPIVDDPDIDLKRQDRIQAVRTFFEAKGYTGDELEDKVNLATAGLEDHEKLELDYRKNTIKIGDKAAVSVSNNINGSLLYFDGNNAYGTRSVNLFSQYLAKHFDVADKKELFKSDAFLGHYDDKGDLVRPGHVDNILNSLQIENEKVRDVFKKNAAKWMTEGMTPDELGFLAHHSPVLRSGDTLANLMDGAFQHLPEETGILRRRDLMPEDITQHGLTVSNITMNKTTLRINRNGAIETDEPIGAFKGLDTMVGGDGESDLTRMLRFLNDYTGFATVKNQVSGNHPTSTNIKDPTSLALSEYADKTRISPFRPVKSHTRTHKGLTESDNFIHQAIGTLKDLGLVPREFETEAMTKVLSVDQEEANTLLRDKGIAVQFGDGYAVSNRSFAQGFIQEQTASVTLKGLENEVALSRSIIDILEARQDYGVSGESARLTTINPKQFKHNLVYDYLKTNRSIWGADKEKFNEYMKELSSLKKDDVDGFNKVLTKVLEEKKDYRIAKSKALGKTYNSAMIDKMLEQIQKDPTSYHTTFLEALEKSEKYTQRVEELERVRQAILDLPEYENRESYNNIISKIDTLLEAPETITKDEIKEINTLINKRNSAAKGVVSGVVGYSRIDANGLGIPEYVPKTLSGKARLDMVEVVETSDGMLEVKVHLNSESLQRIGQTYKIYGSGSKVNEKMLDDETFKAVAELLAGQGVDAESFSMIAESGSTGQKEAMGLYKVLSDTRVSNADLRTALNVRIADEAAGLQDSDIVAAIDKLQIDRNSVNFNEVSRLMKAIPSKISDGMKLEIDSLVSQYRSDDWNNLSKDDISIQNSRSWALTQLVNATSEGKATENAVKGLTTLGMSNFLRDLITTIEIGSDPQSLKRQFPWLSQDLIDDLEANKDFFDYDKFIDDDGLTRLRTEIVRETGEHFFNLQERFRPGELTRNILQGNIFNMEVLDDFTFVYDQVGVSWLQGTKEREANAFTGAGGEEKKLSHFAIQAMVDKGYTKDMIEALSTVDEKVNYDYGAMHATVAEPEANKATLDKFLYTLTEGDQNPALRMKAVIGDILGNGASPYEIRDKLENYVRGVSDQDRRVKLEAQVKEMFDNKPYLYYALPDQDTLTKTTGVRQIPIYLGNTNTGGQTVNTAGKFINSKLTNMHKRIIEASIDHMTEGVEKEDITVKGQVTLGSRSKLVEATTELANFYHQAATSSNNSMTKNVFSRVADNSAFLKVVAASDAGLLEDVDELLKEGRSAVGVSKKRAVQYLRNMGVKISSDDDLEDYLDDDGYLVRKKGSTDRMFFSNSREPTITATGTRLTYVKVVEGVQDEEIAISSRDLYYTRMMSGDMDNDNIYLIASKTLMDDETYDQFKKVAAANSDVDKILIEAARGLGVKSKGRSLQFDYSELINEVKKDLGKFGLTAEDMDAIKGNRVDINHKSATKVLDALDKANAARDQLSSIKAGQRKIVTPTITTMVKTIIDNPEFHTEKDPLIKGMATLVGNYLVENLLKSSHTETGKKNPLDELLDSFKAFAKNAHDKEAREAFVKNLDVQLEAMRKEIRDDPGFDDFVKKKLLQGVDHVKETSNRMSVDSTKNVLLINQALHRLQRTPMIAGGAPSVNLLHVTDTFSYDPGKAASMNLASLTWSNTTVNNRQTTQAGYELIKSTVLDNVKANSIPLAIGAGVIGLTALLTQKEPDFSASNGKVSSGEASAMTLTPHTLTESPTMLERLGRERSAYITPPIDTARFKERAMEAYGGYEDLAQRQSDNLNKAIFGNNISQVRVENNYGYY